MALPIRVSEMEFKKFVLDGNGKVALNTVLNSNVTLNPSSSFIGLVSVAQPVAVTDNSGSLTVDWSSGATVAVSNLPNVNLAAGTNYIGLASVNVGNVVPVSDNSGSLTVDWVSGATVNLSNATLFAVVNTQAAGQASVVLDTGVKWIGLATVNLANQLQAGSNYIGLASVNIGGTLPALSAGTAEIGKLAAGTANIGDVDVLTIAAGGNYIGLASVNIGGTLPALAASSAYIGLASVNIGGTLPALTAGTAYIGLASVNVGNIAVAGGKTLNIAPIALSATNLSGATLMVASASKKWYINSLILSVASLAGIALMNGPTYLAGNASIRMQFASQGGLTQSGDEFPVLAALANQTSFALAVDTASPVAGFATWWEE